jgi:hypothetical protein
MQKIEPKDQIEAAKKVIAFARDLGFTGASITIIDDQDEPHESLNGLAENYAAGDVVPVILTIHLSEDIEVEIVEVEEGGDVTFGYI